MKHLGQAAVRQLVIERIQQLRPDTPRQWGKMNVQQMLMHISGGMERVTRGEALPTLPTPPSKMKKWLGLYMPIPWPRNIPTNIDPAGVEVDAERFMEERNRAVQAVQDMAAADPSTFPPRHPVFADMRGNDWFRWAWRHNDHHLRQFGV